MGPLGIPPGATRVSGTPQGPSRSPPGALREPSGSRLLDPFAPWTEDFPSPMLRGDAECAATFVHGALYLNARQLNAFGDKARLEGLRIAAEYEMHAFARC